MKIVTKRLEFRLVDTVVWRTVLLSCLRDFYVNRLEIPVKISEILVNQARGKMILLISKK